MALVDLIDKLTPVFVVIIPSYFSYKSTKTSKEADQKLRDLSDKIDDLEKSVLNVKGIGEDNKKNLTIIGKGLQRLQRFRLQENLKSALKRGHTNQHEIEELSRLYESYIELGGNGAIKV
ncbi:hypothetical protein K1I98_11490, partial [Streptococcus sanguinis]|uniref:hypothetical protein n=1 Tax=Streptococcus sanguinis TaxID=1305 RepID=UPI001CBCD993